MLFSQEWRAPLLAQVEAGNPSSMKPWNKITSTERNHSDSKEKYSSAVMNPWPGLKAWMRQKAQVTIRRKWRSGLTASNRVTHINTSKFKHFCCLEQIVSLLVWGQSDPLPSQQHEWPLSSQPAMTCPKETVSRTETDSMHHMRICLCVLRHTDMPTGSP